MSHFFISAAHKSSGKTTLSIGLCAGLRARGLNLQPFKKGPDYIDPMWLSLAAGQSCMNLDFYTMSREEIQEVFLRLMWLADIGLIEGNKGLYDGLELDGSSSNAALAALLDAPVVLVIDARGMTRGIAPLILGYQAFDPNIRIGGVILNQVGGSRHESKLRRVIEHYTSVPVLGSVHRSSELQLVERHLGLMPSNETPQALKKVAAIGQAVSEQVDLDRIIQLAASSSLPVEQRVKGQAAAIRPPTDLRIGYPMDAAFGFYYPDDLQALRAAGAELIPFDTLQDLELPAVDGLFIGGGFPETVMEKLESNRSMRAELWEFIEAGGPVYAECGGLMYLSRQLIWNGKVCEMVGAIPGDVRMFERPQGRGYVRLKETGEHLWPRTAGQNGEHTIPAHEFHYSALENLPGDSIYAYEVLRGTGIDGRHDGLIYKNMLASYTHMRDVGANHWTRRFVAHVRACKLQKRSAIMAPPRTP